MTFPKIKDEAKKFKGSVKADTKKYLVSRSEIFGVIQHNVSSPVADI